ncbi:MAG: ribonuclease H family protein [Lachnospiraceae bacterium]|nr:ribonuclease H family protein [Lachnospiraceae bacterium]
MGKKFYAIKNGVVPGIYTDWGEASAQVKGFKGAIYKGFETRAEAEAFMEGTVSVKTNTLPGKVNAANAIGSDETGKGEIFRSLVVTAAFVKADVVGELRDLGVKDSKAYHGNATKLANIGSALTDILPSEDIDWKAAEEGLVTRTDGVIAVTVLLPNAKLESIHTADYNQDNILCDWHEKAITKLQQVLAEDGEQVSYIVIDDFLAGMRTGKRGVKFAKLMEGIHQATGDYECHMEMRADADYMAVSAASIISTYIEQRYLEHLSEVLLAQYGHEAVVPDGPISKPVRDFLKLLKSRDAEEFFLAYGKTSYVK